MKIITNALKLFKDKNGGVKRGETRKKAKKKKKKEYDMSLHSSFAGYIHTSENDLQQFFS